jgi:sec-independent protein translocase protein TatA
MLGNLGFGELLLIGLIALLIFGPNKLPELGRSLGKTIREFRQGAREIMSEVSVEHKEIQSPQTPAPPKSADKPSDNRRLPD